MQHSMAKVQDNLISAKVSQAFQANKGWSLPFPFKVGNQVVLSTLHQCWKIIAGDLNHVAKFMPQFDGPLIVKSTDEQHSTVTLDLLNLPHIFPIFHTSKLHPFRENNDNLFPSRALIPPKPVTINSHQEFHIDCIVNKRTKGKKILYCMHWQGEGPEGNKWLPAKELTDCEALNKWLVRKATHGLLSYINLSVLAGSFFPLGFDAPVLCTPL